MIVTILVLAAAVIVGVIANTRVRPYAKSEVQGVKLELMVSPLLALTTLLLAFVLVQVFTSYNRAKLSAGDEAGRVAGEFRLLQYLNDEHTITGQSALICYARAVVNLEWPIMAESNMEVVPEVSQWGALLTDVLTDVAATRTSQPFGVIISTERDRIDARRRRIAETRPAVPGAVTWLMLGVSAVAILSIATFTLPYVARRVQIGSLTLLTFVFATMQIAILEIDSKYDGWIRVGPEEMELISKVMEQHFVDHYPDFVLPCDADGQKPGAKHTPSSARVMHALD
ncbi:MAG: hypothetical protein DRQ65_05195 [Gammaproteobacteria bacterium]|nr:MAG: hypothetical protein DRQ65_05195 [Gammaproteobacteria bacterium]RLA55422.1 MAG: hypothetical protein DRQ98_05195 [Gammaproteobacteria bacterium]HDY83927.1 DUF4239 domain-containing protein [Halieaceae bacterium]